MTIISNPFARTRRHLPQKYTISTLRSIDIVDNQKDYGCILKFTRFLYENKLHFPCIQYVTAKVAYSAEIAKHPALSGAVAVINCAKFLKTKFLSNSREYGIETLLVVSWVNLLRRFLVLRRPCKSPARSSAVPTSDTLICR